jgi:lauroyl/myristoyl acyltransferase
LRAADFDEALKRLEVPLTPDELERRFLSGVYEDIVMTLREHLPIAWRPAIRLRGAEYISAARAAGRGAILWSCPSAFGGLIAKKALKAAGVELVNLRSAIHPYSGTWFGMKLVNPVRTRIEDRYLGGTVTLEGAGGLRALQELRGYLEANTVITIAANGSEGTPLAVPFLGGTLKLSLGAPTLAALQGAPLLPVFTVTDGTGGFDVIVGPPVKADSRGYPGETARELARSYATVLEAHLRRHPTEWRGWFARNTWRPRLAEDGCPRQPRR